MATNDKDLRAANQIKEFAEAILKEADTPDGSILTPVEKDRITEIAKLAGEMDASTGKSDHSTKKKRSVAAKKGRKRAGSGR